MRAAAALLGCAILLAAACGGGGGEAVTTATTGTGETGTTGTTATSGGDGTQGCNEKAGEVKQLLPTARRGCNEATFTAGSHDSLFAGYELATSGSSSLLTFQLDLASGTAECGMSDDAAALIRPDPAIDVKVLAGTVSCSASAVVTFAAPGVEATNKSTLFSLTVDGDTTTIRLYEGTLEVRSTADGTVQQLDPPAPTAEANCLSASQAVATTSEPMQQTDYTVDASELTTTAIVKLRVGLVPSATLEGLAAGMSEAKATVVTATDAQKKVLLERDIVRQVPLMTVAALRQPSVEQPIQPGETVVGVGSFPALLPTFCAIQRDVADARLLYTPFAFAGGTTTDTGTTSTESGTTSTGTETATETATDTGTTPP